MMKSAVVIVMVFISSVCFGHSQGTSYLLMEEQGGQISAQWKVPLKELDKVLDLDWNRDGYIQWNDLLANQDRIINYVFSTFVIQREYRSCDAHVDKLMLENLNAGLFVFIPFKVDCPVDAVIDPIISLDSKLFQSANPMLKTVLNYTSGKREFVQILSGVTSSAEFRIRQSSIASVTRFIKEGIWHIVIGFDHLLFLAALVLPVVLSMRPNQSVSQENQVKPIVKEVSKVVTAFTVAHSVTLALAASETIQLSATLVECSIALSVVVGAVLALIPRFDKWRWSLAFGFGLIHGFGFANVLADLVGSVSSFMLALFAFNLGVEFGQIVLVVIILPILFLIRRNSLVQRYSLASSMAVICVFGVVWFYERAALLV